jgi:hypothetical protein
MTLSEAIWKLKKDGGYKSHNDAARAFDIQKAYWHRMKNGQLSNPSPATLAKLGLKKVVSYEELPNSV